LPSADRFKDFVANHFFGSLGVAIAYLALTNDGYVWCDHFENLGGGNPATGTSPDFVFARDDHKGVALLESKATRRANSRRFDNRVADGYLEQVEPHLGYTAGNVTASHGYCIGSWLTSPDRAELFAHYTEPQPQSSDGEEISTDPFWVQQNNFATAFQLAYGTDLSAQIRHGQLERSTIPFLEFEWLGRQWLTSSIVRQTENGMQGIAYMLDGPNAVLKGPLRPEAYPFTSFAIEETCALAILKGLRFGDSADVRRFELKAMPRQLRSRAREEYWGAVFADGLAVVSGQCQIGELTEVIWHKESAQLQRLRDS
jgi:hypothetical protein